MTNHKKLIEVALPLEAINKASAREKSIRHGHPSTLHLWWARRPLAAARAVIFAQMVDDPSAHPDKFPTEEAQEKERQRLFRLIEELVQWENTTNETVLAQARDEIWKSWRTTCAENKDHPHAAELFNPDKLPAFHDPFAGGGSLPLEAQRLGLESYASDLNPVAVLINKAMIEIPPKFAGRPPVHPEARKEKSLIDKTWRGAQGLAEDVRYYGQWMRDEAEKRIGHLYPKVSLPSSKVSLLSSKVSLPSPVKERGSRGEVQQATVIAWLWARTVKSPNPAFAQVDVPLASTFMLSTKPGKEAYVEPVLTPSPLAGEGKGEGALGYHFTVKMGKPKDAEGAKNGTKLARGANFKCLMSGTPIAPDYIKAEGRAGRMGARLMAIVAEGERGRVYLPPTPEHEAISRQAQATWKPETPLPDDPRNFWTVQYGLTHYGDLFTPRQLVALTTFSDLVQEAREKVKQDCLSLRTSLPGLLRTSPLNPLSLTGEGGETSPLNPLSLTGEGEEIGEGKIGEGKVPLLPSGRRGQGDEVPQHQGDEVAEKKFHGIISNASVSVEKLNLARQMRKLPTAAEATAWALLRDRQCLGLKFRRQQVIRGLIVDFYCAEKRLAVELDGPIHDQQQEYDQQRDAILGAEEISVLRIRNERVTAEYLVEQIQHYLHYLIPLTPFSLTGEGGGKEGAEIPSPSPVTERGSGGEVSPPSPVTERESEGEVSPPSPVTERGSGGEVPSQADSIPLANGGTGATAYAEAVTTYLVFAINKLADRGSTICGWDSSRDSLRNTFGRQAIPMVWDYAEANPFSESSGSYDNAVDQIAKVINEYLPAKADGSSSQADAAVQSMSAGKTISTDPPYYDNIGYADLSDFFYVWLRRSLKLVFPDLFATLAVPKAEELVATPYRHGSKEKAESFFLNGMTQAMHRLAEQAHPAFPVTIYYAFKQSETESEAGTSSTGWETFIDAVIRAGFAISGTWPMRTELTGNLKKNVSALASSIILVCRKRAADAPTITRREFLTALKGELPVALAHLQRGNIAPVDLAQAAIGPGMAVYTRYAKVLNAEGKAMRVREALTLINQTLDEVLAEQEGDFDADSRWALAWFEQFGFTESEYGVAETLSKAKNTSVSGMREAGIVASKGGKVRLLKPEELPDDWDPAEDMRLTVWEMVHHLVRALKQGETAAAKLVVELGAKADTARELAYRLYTVCERKKRASEALSYNALVQSWPEIMKLARQKPEQVQTQLL